jgi:hypothetical protein
LKNFLYTLKNQGIFGVQEILTFPGEKVENFFLYMKDKGWWKMKTLQKKTLEGRMQDIAAGLVAVAVNQ